MAIIVQVPRVAAATVFGEEVESAETLVLATTGHKEEVEARVEEREADV